LSVNLGPAAVANTNRAPINYQSHLFYFDGTAFYTLKTYTLLKVIAVQIKRMNH